jgi:hypothetical protein
MLNMAKDEIISSAEMADCDKLEFLHNGNHQIGVKYRTVPGFYISNASR